MKTLAELEAIREKTLDKVTLRREHEGVRIVVGMATCGIAAGARQVVLSFVEEVKKRNLPDVIVAQSGCFGMCRLEPMVEVHVPGQKKVTYANIKPDMVARIVEEHIAGGKPVAEYAIDVQDK